MVERRGAAAAHAAHAAAAHAAHACRRLLEAAASGSAHRALQQRVVRQAEPAGKGGWSEG